MAMTKDTNVDNTAQQLLLQTLADQAQTILLQAQTIQSLTMELMQLQGEAAEGGDQMAYYLDGTPKSG